MLPPPLSLPVIKIVIGLCRQGQGVPKSYLRIVYLYVKVYKKKSEIFNFDYSFGF